jgi:hypothetical protein
VTAAIIVAVLALASLNLVMGPGYAADVQAAVITPVAQTARDGSRIATFFDVRAITADTRVCFDLADFQIMDLQYRADATETNTTTISLQQTNIDPTAGPFNTAQTVATVVATDADIMSQVGLFGRWNCVFADVANTNPITLTIIGVAK